MLSANLQTCFGTDRQVASDFPENHALIIPKVAGLSDCGVKDPLCPIPRQNPLVQSRILFHWAHHTVHLENV
jgi:hypothetical protein